MKWPFAAFFARKSRGRGGGASTLSGKNSRFFDHISRSADRGPQRYPKGPEFLTRSAAGSGVGGPRNANLKKTMSSRSTPRRFAPRRRARRVRETTNIPQADWVLFLLFLFSVSRFVLSIYPKRKREMRKEKEETEKKKRKRRKGKEEKEKKKSKGRKTRKTHHL